MKTYISLTAGLCLILGLPQGAAAWSSFLDGSSLPQNNGWLLDGNSAGTLVDLGDGNRGIQQVDDTVNEYDEWYVVNAHQASTLAARFRIDSYGGGPVNLLQLTTANSAANPCPFIAIAIREGRFFLIRVLADSRGQPAEVARLADLGAVEGGVFNEAYLYVDNATDRIRLFWNGGLRYTAVETEADYLFGAGEGYAEFGASNYWPDNDRSGICTVTFDWVGLGNASDLPLNLPFIPWTLYLDGSALPEAPWQLFTTGDAGTTTVIDFTDPANGAANQALQLNSGTGANEWYVGAFFEDEVFGGARFTVEEVSPEGKENLVSIVTRSQPLSPAPAITLVDGRFKLWSYVDPNTPGNPGSEIMDIGPVVLNEWHTAYLYARKDGRVKLWWDSQLVFDGMAPLVNPFDGYFEWGSGSWQYDASDIVDFDWVAYGAGSPPPALTTVPAHGAMFHDPSAGFRFTYVSEQGVAANGVGITVNGVDRTGDWVIGGDNNNRQGSLGGLEVDRLYRVVLTLTDLGGDSANYTIIFDTFRTTNFTFEAEDWNFDAGQFLDQIVLASTPQPNNYVGRGAMEDIDQNELSTDPGASQHQYRDSVLVGTEQTGDILRQQYLDAQAQDPAVADYNVGWVDVGEWLNYSRTFPAGIYYIYGRFAADSSIPLFEAALDQVTDPMVNDQITSPLGVFRGGPGRAWQTYEFVPLTDGQGNLVAVELSGVATLRVTCTQGGYNANFYTLVPARGPALRILRSASNVVVSWEGSGWILQWARAVTGRWEPVPNQSNPFPVPLTERARFFRLAAVPPPPPETVVRFDDLSDGALDGSYAGLDWGMGLWGVGGAWAGINSKNVFFNTGGGEPTTSRISAGPDGAFLLKSLLATADRNLQHGTHGQYPGQTGYGLDPGVGLGVRYIQRRMECGF